MSLQRYDVAYLAVVVVEQRFVERETYGSSDAELGDVEELEYVCGGGIEAEDFGTEIIQEYFSGIKAKNKLYGEECHRHHTVFYAFSCPCIIQGRYGRYR